MNLLVSLLSILLLATSLLAQNAPIPQQLPSELRRPAEAIQRGVEQPMPRDLPLQRPTKRLDSFGLPNKLRATDRRTPAANESTVNAGRVEDRIAALEAKVDELQSELEAQKALIKHLQELLDRQQQKKN
jgi:hypothetical protein